MGAQEKKKKKPTLTKALLNGLNDEVQVSSNDRTQVMSMAEAFAKKLLQQAMNSSPKLKLDMLKEFKKLGLFDLHDDLAEDDSDDDPFTEEHRRLVEIAKREVLPAEFGDDSHS
ncbi:MAG: hypothetical protein M3Q08_01920 [Pseudomonadota bacterium]|nr:hypothetical protein [Pseudomonadota bacterium]